MFKPIHKSKWFSIFTSIPAGMTALALILGCSFEPAPPVPGSGSADLGELFRKYGTDKDINGYTSIYHTLFNRIRNNPVALLEIGIGTMLPDVHSSMLGYAAEEYKPGGSLRAWRDYFPNGTIYGADVQSDTQFEEPRINTFLCNSMDKSQVDELFAKIGGMQFDIIIDDGSHIDINQLITLEYLYPHLKEDGIYIIEDIYPGSLLTTNPDVLEKLCNHDPYFFVGIKNNICVIYKNHLKRSSKKYAY